MSSSRFSSAIFLLRSTNSLISSSGTRHAGKRSPFIRQPVASYVSEGEIREADPQIGDYPNLPWKSQQLRSPHGWWDPQRRRNFQDTLHIEEDALDIFGPDRLTDPVGKEIKALITFFGVVGVSSYFISKNFDPPPAILKKPALYDERSPVDVGEEEASDAAELGE